MGVSGERNEPDAGTAAIGALVGGFRIESMLGEGAMGRVYKARGADGEEVALKVIREDLATDPIFRKRFEREARAAQRIVNPHVVPVLDTGEHHGVPYLAQRLIAGGTLQERLDREARLTVEGVVRLCADVAAGLDALVGSGLIHRDVKPSNVLLELDGRALITDFGLAKDNNATELTRPGQALGSLQYMAPEQIRAEQVDSSADVYSLGCVVYHCLKGSPPFGGYEGMRVLWAQLQEEPEDPTAGLEGAPPELGPAVLAALAKDPAARPSSAGEYARMLRSAMADADS